MLGTVIGKLLRSSASVREQCTGASTVAPRGDALVEGTIAEAMRLVAQSRYGAALALVDHALSGDADSPALLIARGRVLHHWGRHRDAREHLLQIESRLIARDAAFYHTLGLACLWANDAAGAERGMRRALEREPDDWDHLFGLGMALSAQQRHGEAREAFGRALELRPDDPHCLANLVSCAVELRDLEPAERLARRMAEIDPANFVSWSNLGVVLDRLHCHAEAIASFEKATEVAASAGARQESDFLNYAISLLRASRAQEAIRLLESRLPGDPLVQAHCHYSLALLHSGRMKEGWDQFEYRWVDGPLKAARPNFVKPMWIGQDLAGKTILVRAEQGYGDFFQFIRYAPQLKALGARVLLALPELVREIANYAEGIDHVLKPHEPYPPFDYYADLLGLPRIFGTHLSSVPCDIPYVKVDPERRNAWRKRLGTGTLNIGIAWAGSPTHARDNDRSMGFDAFRPLAEVEGVTFYSLQKGPAAADARGEAAGLAVVDLEAELADFVDTAALIDVLDLVICIDTSVAHLAGALGKPVWVMVTSFSDWRWLERTQETPWYPTMHIFRQPARGDWAGVVDSVKAELCAVLDRTSSLPKAPDRAARSPTRLQPRLPGPPDPRLCAATRTRKSFLQYLPSQETLAQSIQFYGEYLQPQVDLLARIIASDATIVEVGPGIGVHAIALAGTAPEGRVYLYENRPLLRKILNNNLAANDVAIATMMKCELRGCHPAANGAGEATARTDDDGETIDELRLEKLNLLKTSEHCDPVTVIEGAAETLWRHRPYVFCAVEDAEHASRLAECMTQFGYRSWRMDTPLFNPDNFNGQVRDIFAGRSAHAVLAVPEEIEMDVELPHCVELR